MATSSLVALRLGSEALVGLICLLAVLSNLFVLKEITLFGLHVTAADAFSVGVILCLQLLQEYYGSNLSKKAIWICFFGLILYTITTQIHLWYIPNLCDNTATHFRALLQCAPRITSASLFVYLAVQHLDRFVYAKLQSRCGQRYLIARSYTALLVSQLADTVLFSFLGLYGIVSNITHVIVASFAIKLVTIFISTPFVVFSKKIFRPNK